MENRENCYIGFGAVLRADFGTIRIGNETLVEENVVIHTATQTRLGNRVIIGHMVMIHDAVILTGKGGGQYHRTAQKSAGLWN